MGVDLPEGRYCDLSSLQTQRGWREQAECPRSVEIDARGVVTSGQVAEGEVLAIHTGARHMP